MRLDIRYQPLNFDIYLSQVIEVPRTSLQEQPYDFHSENEALERVDQIIERTQRENKDLNSILDTDSKSQIPSEPTSDFNNISDTDAINQNLVNTVLVAPPSCPTETPLTPIKSTVIPSSSSSDGSSATGTNSQHQKQSEAPLFNPRDFEDIHYKFDPFDHAELQTIDERRELDMIFQAASFANQSNK